MTVMQPNRKDMAEFFRLSLHAGICTPATVVQWADRIVAADASPHIAFIELCMSAFQPASAVGTLLGDVPGQATADLSVQMLLGYAARLIAERTFAPEELLLRLYRLAGSEFPGSIYFELVGLESAYICARDGVFGTVAEVMEDFATFLANHVRYAPDLSM
ncbi:MAG: hypothetical protein QM796_21030 [Chthoniobacteraceae bacterium]